MGNLFKIALGVAGVHDMHIYYRKLRDVAPHRKVYKSTDLNR